MRPTIGVVAVLSGLTVLYCAITTGRSLSVLLEEEGTESFSAAYGPFGTLGSMAFVILVALVGIGLVFRGVCKFNPKPG